MKKAVCLLVLKEVPAVIESFVILAVEFTITNKTCYAEIWFRWWAPGVND